MRSVRFVILSYGWGLLAGCGSASSAKPSDGGNVGSAAAADAAAPGDGSEVGTVTWTQAYAVMSANCTTHHTTVGGIAPYASLDLGDKDDAYVNLVGMYAAGPSCGDAGASWQEAAGLVRVVPGNAGASLLYHKIHDSAPACGAQMPKGLPPLTDSDQQLIADWINAGALND